MLALVAEPSVIIRILTQLERRGVDARAGPWAGDSMGVDGEAPGSEQGR
jgi:hypothetical protein